MAAERSRHQRLALEERRLKADAHSVSPTQTRSLTLVGYSRWKAGKAEHSRRSEILPRGGQEKGREQVQPCMVRMAGLGMYKRRTITRRYILCTGRSDGWLAGRHIFFIAF